MSNKNLFKEAIADAKAVREAALANAKAALEEALTPKLQSMLAAKLNEMEYEEEGYMSEDEEMEEGFMTNQFNWQDEDNSETDQNKLDENEDLEEDFDLSEILAELEEDENLSEAKKEKEEEDKKKKKKMMKEAEEEEEEEEEEESEDVADMSVEDLKALIKDIVAQEMGNEEGGEEAGEETEMGGEEESSDEINLDELLAELDALGEGKDDDDKEEMEEGMFGDFASKVGQGLKKASTKFSAAAYGVSPEIIAKCKEEKDKGGDYYKCLQRSGAGFAKSGYDPENDYWGSQEEGFKKSSELKEAIDTINTLRSELNEVNLLNAKLLYVNKIFKAKNLSESQKLQVIASFDKATTAKEAKVVYESLNNTLTAAPKQAIKESYGFASRAAGVAPKKAIVESNDVITRMQKLANIIK